MKTRYELKLAVAVFAVLALGMVVQPASASVTGTLDFSACPPNGGVQVSLALIDWQQPIGSGFGNICAGVPTAVTFSTGTLDGTSVGTINDLSSPPTAGQNAGFITFPGVMFNLASIGPGAGTTVCAGLAVNASCSATAGSPFILTLRQDALGNLSTDISLLVSGLATDSISTDSFWRGVFTTQVSETPAQIQTTVLGGGSITASFSFDGVVAAPEPVSMALIGGGLIGLALLRRRKSLV